MPSFTPPIVQQGSDDPFFGRYLTNAGVSVVWDGTTFVAQPYPWLGEIQNLVEGKTWFQGGRVYQVDDITAGLLQNAGFVTEALGYGEGGYGVQGYGGSL